MVQRIEHHQRAEIAGRWLTVNLIAHQFNLERRMANWSLQRTSFAVR